MARLTVFTLSVVVLLSLACGFAAPPPTPTPSPTAIPIPEGSTVIEHEIEGGFIHQTADVKVGTFIRWTNNSTNAHSVTHTPTKTGEETLFDILLQTEDTMIFQFTEPGEYRYTCLLHPIQMVGFINVTE